MKIIGGYEDTRDNGEDMALTPYLALVYYKGDVKVYGLAICWIYFAAYIGIGINIPKNFPRFKKY